MTAAPNQEFSDEATALYATAVTSYADSLETLAKHCAIGAETVLVDHVKDALALLGPSGQSTLLDWIKRLAFLAGGITTTLGLQILFGQQPPVRSQILSFVIILIITTALFVTALNADV